MARARRPGRLRNAGITLKDVIDAVAASNGATSGGYLQLGESELVVRGRGYLKSPPTSATRS
jgi:Cu/Ag efflux pump CusA